MSFSLPIPPGQAVSVRDANDFNALSQQVKNIYATFWDVNDTSVFHIHVHDPALAPWVSYLGGGQTDRAGEAPVMHLEYEKIECLLVRALTGTGPVADKRIGEYFVAPSRLGDALQALMANGLDLRIDEEVSAASAATVLLRRINAVLNGGAFQLLPLRTVDLIPTVATDLDPNHDMDRLWPSYVTLGSLVQPADSSLAPAADLIGLLGFRLHPSDREHPDEQFVLISRAAVAHQLVGPMAFLGDDSKADLLAGFIVDTSWHAALDCACFSFPAALGDIADRIAYLAPDTSSAVIRKRFTGLVGHLSNTIPFLHGAPAPQQYSLAVGLCDQLLDLKDNTSLAALFALDAHLEGKSGLLDVHEARDKSPQERVAVLLAHADNQEEARSASTSTAPTTDAVSSSSSAAGSALKYHKEMSAYLLSNDCVAPAMIIPNQFDANGMPTYDEPQSGLLALLDTVKDSHVNQLRVLFGRRNVFVTQALLTNFHHRSGEQLFKIIADARAHMVKYLSMSVVTDDDGTVKPHDMTFELDEGFVKDFLAGKWETQNFHQHLLVRLHAHRSRSLAPKNVAKQQQWLLATATATGKLTARMFAALGYMRFDSQLGFTALLDIVLAYVASSPLGVDHSALGVKIIDSALKSAARRWIVWTRSPPGSTAPTTFLEKDDPCFELLTDAHKAQDDLFVLANAYPSIVSNLSRSTDSGSGGGGGHGGGGGSISGGGSPAAAPSSKAKKRKTGGNGTNPSTNPNAGSNSNGARSAPPASSQASASAGSTPSGKPIIAPKSLADKCSWNGRVLTFEREYFDTQSKSYVALQSDIVDVGAFCQATGADFNKHCWEYVCSVFLQSIAQNNAPQHGRNLAAARCKHFGSPGHTETPSGKHAMPARISEMRQYFRRG